MSAVATVDVAGTLAAFTHSAPDVPVADGFGPGDGLHRYVVTLTGDEPGVLPPAELTTSAGTDGPAVTSAGRHADRLDIALLSRAQTELGADGRVVAYGSDPYYVTDAGAMLVGPGGDGSVVTAASLPSALADDARQAPAAGSDDTALASLAARQGVTSAQWLSDGTVLVASSLSEAAVAAFPEVAAVTPSVEASVLGEVSGEVAGDALAGATVTLPDDPYLGPYGWNLLNTGTNAYQQAAVAGADVDAPTAWTVTQGQGIVVAVVDTGFDSDHPDLVGSLWTNPSEACGSTDTNGNGKPGDCHGWNFYANSADVDNGALGEHGTSVAGVIGARANNREGSAGVAPQVTLMPLVVGGGSNVDVYLAAEAIRYAADNGADVINASFGGAFGGSALTNLSAAVDYAIGKGVVVVAAAGNDGANRDSSAMYPANLENPALLTVAATTAMDTVPSWSAYGATTVDLGAPGETVVTTWNDGGYRLVSGTSTAAPHVAAAAALHLSMRDRTPAQVREALLADAEPLAALAGRTVSGGRLTVGPLATNQTSTTYAFSGMVARPGTQTPVVEVTSTAPAGTYTVTLGLVMRVEGQVWAVSGEDITLGGVTVATDDTGTATFPLGALSELGSRNLEPVLTLGAGDFGLTVQVARDGEALTRPYAAPLVVVEPSGQGDGGTADPGTGTDPGTGGTVDPGGDADPGDGGQTNPGTGGGTQPGDGSDPGTGGGSTPPGGGGSTDPGDGGGSTDPGTGGGSTDPGTGGGIDPGTGGSTQPGSGGSGAPGGSGGTAPGTTPGGDSGSGSGSDPGTGGGTSDPPTGGGTAPSGPDVAAYDRVGAFAITQVSPVHVPATGGTLVSVRGDALESGLSVRVGAMATADVLMSTPQLLVFRTPARVPGTYDVTVSRLGRTSVLTGALVYMASGGSGGTTPPGTGGSTDPGSGGSTDPGSGGSTDPGTGGSSGPGTGGSTDPGAGGGAGPGTDPGTGGSTDPGGTDPGGTGPGTGTGDGDGGGSGGGSTTPQTPAANRVGPNGERLVRHDALSSLAGLWSRQCVTRCAGVQL